MTFTIQLQNVTLYWLIFKITNDPLSLGLIGLFEAIPSLAVVMFAGYAADKFDRSKILQYAALLFLLCSAAITCIGYGYYPHYLPQHYWFYLAVFFSGIARGFYRPANFAILPQILPRNLIATGSAWNSVIWQIASVSGSAAAGFLIASIQPENTFLIAFILAVLAFLAILKISSKKPEPSQITVTMWQGLGDGLKFVYRDKVILGAMSLDLVAVLFGGATALLSIFASDILKVGPTAFGLLNAAQSAGAIITSIALAYYPPGKSAGILFLWAVAGFGICMIGFALSKLFILAFFFLFLSGMCDAVSVVVRSAIMQLLTPDDMRGRVSAVNTMFIGSSNEIGAFESGLAARVFGLIPSVVFGGAIAIASAGTAGIFNKKLKNLDLNKFG